MCFDCLVGWRAEACFVPRCLGAKACAPRGWRFNEVAGAAHRLPCDARCRGYAAELTARLQRSVRTAAAS